jgi:hypothetical protein
MLKFQESWVKQGDGHLKKDVQYSLMEFCGPFVDFGFRKQSNGENLTVTPVKNYAESAENSKSQFDLIVLASQEIYKEFGKFTLNLPAVKQSILIESVDDVEKKMLEFLKNIKLF